MRRLLAATVAAVFAAGLWSCASAPPPPPPAPAAAPAPEPEPAPVPAEVSWLVGSKSVNVRETASTKAASVARLSKGARLTSFEEKDGWLHVKLADSRTGWIRKDLLRKDDGCLPDRREVLLTPPMLHMSEGSSAPGTAGAKGKVVVEAEIDEKGTVRAVRVVRNDTGSPERAETAKSEVQGVTFQPPVKRCRVTGFTYVYTRTF
ncbi:MAG TPA: SH3 domain-containing protein [Thermoanaerobaculia bacterium]